MVSTWPSEIALLRDLIAIPSISGSEETIAIFVETAMRQSGLDVVRDATGVKMMVDGAPGPTLAFASHLDVVPPGEGWTRDPFQPVIEGDRLYGRGSGDAKASVAAMLTAAGDFARQSRKIRRGRLLVLLSYCEETKDATMPALRASVEGTIDAAVIGEPTNLAIAVAQRGLMMIDLVARGDQRHAGYAGDPGYANAVMRLAQDLVKLPSVVSERLHPILGTTTVTPTMLEAGVSRNVTPAVARAVLDVRSTPAWTHRDLAHTLQERLSSEVIVTSDRLVPCETPADSRLLRSARTVRPDVRSFGSPTCSDWVFLRDLDAFKCGPGTSTRSHTVDESVDLPEVSGARSLYAELAREYLS